MQATVDVRSQEVQLANLRQTVEAEVRDAVQGVELSWRQLEAAGAARDGNCGRGPGRAQSRSGPGLLRRADQSDGPGFHL